MGKMGEAMNNNGTDLFEGTLDALDGITEGTGLNVKPVERGGFNPPLSFNEQLDEILDYLLEPNTDDETPEGTIRNYRTLVLHDSEFQVRQAEAKQAIKQLITQAQLALLTRLEAKAGWYSQLLTDKARRDPSVEDTLIPLTAIQAERAKLKEGV